MTDPLMPAFICKKPSSWTMFYDMVLKVDSTIYNTICLISATCGILGAAYQILPQMIEYPVQHWYWISSQRTRKIIIWLAVSDLLASVGIFLRSLMNLCVPTNVKRHILINSLNCYSLSFLIQYFYIVSWFWTLIYSLDMWLALKDKPSYLKVYHSLAWILPAILTLIGLYILYFPIDRCSTTGSNSLWRYLPNYLVSYIPLLTVMIINPILYSLSSASIPNLISQYLSQYTNTERKIVDKIKIKYGLINLTFYICWLPNIAAAILIFSSWDNFPEKAIIILWYIMAFVNPLQAFFNSMVYGKPATKKFCFWKSDKYLYDKYYEKTPLLLQKRAYSNDIFEKPDTDL